MGNGLTVIGYIWVLLSVTAGCAVTVGLFVPVWLEGWLTVHGDVTATTFGVFRRCAYPVLDEKRSELKLVKECGRYSSFNDIPSLWWQLASGAVAVAAVLALFVAMIALPSLVCNDVMSRTSARLLGVMQLVSAICLSLGLLLYPLGWGAREVRESCGHTSAPYSLGSCQLGWTYFLLMSCVVLLIMSAGMSAKAAHPVRWRKQSVQKQLHIDYADEHTTPLKGAHV